MKKLLLPFCFAICFFSLHAQDQCGLEIMTQSLIQSNPEVVSELKTFDRFVQSTDQTESNHARQVINIPVVVHIIYQNNLENIPDSRVYDQIQTLNEDYNRQNADKSQTPNSFKDDAGIGDIRFTLVSKTPNGSASNGITRHQYNSITNNGFIESTIKPATAWDTERYLNIWVLKMPNQNILGYSYLPVPTILTTHKDGLVVDYNHFGKINSANKGRTATHEIGHYLGLKHPWGDKENCTSDDGISDTPKTSSPFYGCPNFPQSKCNGQSAMFMNFMDYVSDQCMNVFTKGQISVMRNVLINKRSKLIDNVDPTCNNLELASIRMGFENNESKSKWLKEDANGDGKTWSFTDKSSDEWGPRSGSGYASYQWNDKDITIAGDDYLFTPCFDIQKDIVYELSFSYACSSDDNGVYPEKLEVGFSSTGSSRDFSVINDDWKLNNINNAFPEYETISLKFRAQSDFTATIGFHAYSDANQYTLQIDDIKISNTVAAVSTNEVANIVGIQITPNPATNFVNWSILDPIYNEGQISIYDMMGHQVHSFHLSSNQKNKRLDISNLSPAIYFIETVLDGKKYSSKLVITN